MEFRVSEEDSKKSGIYRIKSLIDNRVYYGSAKEFKDRYTGHVTTLKNSYHKNPPLQAFYNKYGFKYLIFEVVEIVDDIKNLLKREQVYLDLVFSSQEEKPFNILKIAGSCLGVKRSAEYKRKQSERMMGRPIWPKGTKMSESFLQTQREVKTRPVAQYSLDGVLIKIYPKYKDRKTLFETTNVKKSGLIAACCGRIHSYRGYLWKFYKKSPLTEISKEELAKLNPKPMKKISIYSIEGELLKTFNSAKEAEKATHTCRTHIKNICLSENNIYKNMFWVFENEKETFSLE